MKWTVGVRRCREGQKTVTPGSLLGKDEATYHLALKGGGSQSFEFSKLLNSNYSLEFNKLANLALGETRKPLKR